MNNLYQIYEKAKLFFNKDTENDKIIDFQYIFEDSFKIKLYELKFIENKNKIIDDILIIDDFFNKIKKLINNEPLGYILGYQNFYDLKFKVGPGVFIPRSDTENLIDFCNKYIIKKIKNNNIKLIDLCSGAGTIALTLKNKFKNISVTAVEKFSEPFKYLCENSKINNLNINLINECIFSCYKKFKDKTFDILVSNPPYIPTYEINDLEEKVKKEPFSAFDGKEDGLYFYKNIIKFWKSKIKDNGIIVFEIGINQKKQVINLLLNSNFKFIEVKKDLNKIDRVIIAKI